MFVVYAQYFLSLKGSLKKMELRCVLRTCLLLLQLISHVAYSMYADNVVYAVNAGGESHVDSFEISYLADPLDVGVASDYGRRQPIIRAAPQDNILYQTERWHEDTFAYEIPIKKDGDYVLVLKFAEVYFYGPNQKVFNVQLNGRHLVLQDLDIFSSVGHSTAHDEIIPLNIKNGKLSVLGEYSTFNGVLKVEFVKGLADNPKICAFYLLKGTPRDVPRLPDLPQRAPEGEDEIDDDIIDDEEDEDFDDEDNFYARANERPQASYGSKSKSKFKSGPPAINPYADDSSSLVVPILIAVAVFIPTLLCMCRL